MLVSYAWGDNDESLLIHSHALSVMIFVTAITWQDVKLPPTIACSPVRTSLFFRIMVAYDALNWDYDVPLPGKNR